MGVSNAPNNGNGKIARPVSPATGAAPRAPRRLVLLADGEDSAVVKLLAEYQGDMVSGRTVHADVQRFATENAGRCVAAEWLGPLGWTRFLWCRK